MIAFAELLERLTLTPGRLAKTALLKRFFETEPDPDRGWGLAALTGELAFDLAKPGIIRVVAERRFDPVLFGWSYDFVGAGLEGRDHRRRRRPRCPTSSKPGWIAPSRRSATRSSS